MNMWWSLEFETPYHSPACRLLHDDQKESGLLPVLGRLIKGFNFNHQNRSHAADLVEALHVVLRLLERLSSAGLCAWIISQAIMVLDE